MTTTRLLGGGPTNQRDRDRFANFDAERQQTAADIAFRLYDGTRTVATCWKLALAQVEA
jgi:hypothetical protein